MNNNNKYDLEQQSIHFQGTIEEEQLQINIALDKHVKKMNKQWAKLDQEGNMHVIRLTPGKDAKGNDQHKFITYTYAKFRERMLQEPKLITNVYVDHNNNKKYKKENQADAFLQHENSKFYINGVSMNPYMATEKDTTHKTVYNMYKGLAVKPEEHDINNISTFIEIVEKVLCDNNKKYSDFLLDLIAWQFANPDQKSQVAVLFRGKGGTFKGTFMENLRAINSHHYVSLNGKKQLTGNFNAILAYATTVFVDEVDFKDQATADALKSLITDPLIVMENKGKDAFNLPSYINIFASTNRSNKLELESINRRWFCIKTADKYAAKGEDVSLHINLKQRHLKQQEQPGYYSMLLDFLLTRAESLPSDWWAQDMMPQTEEEIQLKESSISPKQQWAKDSIAAGYFLGGEGSDNDKLEIPDYEHANHVQFQYRIEHLKLYYSTWCKHHGKQPGKTSQREFRVLFEEQLECHYSKPTLGETSQIPCITVTSRKRMIGNYNKNILGIF